ncbi:MAG: twin-arginine translocase subunit TatC [Candidatus Omnitrophica bacterium]|nr:twin-arginine translocase subunit TatC [Candidatus Omnitrophota bacterium]
MVSDYLSHLEELRRRFIISLTFFFAASVVCYFFSHKLLDFLTAPLRQVGDFQVVFQKPHEAFFAHLKAALLAGLILSTPVLFAQIWLFVSPGLYPREKKVIFPLVFTSVFLFAAGVIFAFYGIVPWALRFFLSFQTERLKPLIGIGPYFSFMAGTMLAVGLIFDLPVIVIGLVNLGAVSSQSLGQARKTIIVLIFVAAAVLTPTPDPVTQILFALPLLLLFEISLLLARWTERKRA